ncbi:deoxyguanosinetriphosphate triphosphohydrolase [Egibacter rhizosphaerae]|uniref:Deoxyguanosinetriphosphate triphosphohydrolase n=1 Tax=Egibacter rhizosphaerae TaxID=1670831 RepID=A0A411YDV3_9ACTN|nr:deoxyguanosinetriphosphate triphosphohydrolase [Egibacter rhizosphaerae]QBI19317.1 deoxyguanosinetriphosphate triphosphohydrolase [Egibacter rhizosphaerae]
MTPPAIQLRDRGAREAAEQQLSPIATRSTESRGRVEPEPPCRLRTSFERDRDRILHSKAFRRLKHKTQVFINPEGDHYVTRMTHALQVSQVARALAAALSLNEPLTEAIALGHDCGHTPFGHTGEDALDQLVDGGWHHAAQGVRIFERLEPCNLTWEVRDGIRGHTWKIDPPPATPEGTVVRFADRIAYLSHDALDAMRAGLVAPERFPDDVRRYLGQPGREWIERMIDAVVDPSVAAGEVTMDPRLLEVMGELRDFMFREVYLSPENEAHKSAAVQVIRQLVEYHLEYPQEVPESYRDADADLTTRVVDYVAGMTDRYALARHDELFRPVLFDEPRRTLG